MEVPRAQLLVDDSIVANVGKENAVKVRLVRQGGRKRETNKRFRDFAMGSSDED